MGCGGSKKNERGHSSLVEKQVSVHVGDQVKAVGDGPVIIFVFGKCKHLWYILMSVSIYDVCLWMFTFMMCLHECLCLWCILVSVYSCDVCGS